MLINVELEIPVPGQGPGMGGAMPAMVPCGAYPNVKACCEKFCSAADRIDLEPAPVEKIRKEVSAIPEDLSCVQKPRCTVGMKTYL